MAWTSADHLSAAAAVLRARTGPAPLYTLMRGVAEACASGSYLTGEGVDDRERVRRYMRRRHQARSRWYHKRARLARDAEITLLS